MHNIADYVKCMKPVFNPIALKDDPHLHFLQTMFKEYKSGVLRERYDLLHKVTCSPGDPRWIISYLVWWKDGRMDSDIFYDLEPQYHDSVTRAMTVVFNRWVIPKYCLDPELLTKLPPDASTLAALTVFSAKKRYHLFTAVPPVIGFLDGLNLIAQEIPETLGRQLVEIDDE